MKGIYILLFLASAIVASNASSILSRILGQSTEEDHVSDRSCIEQDVDEYLDRLFEQVRQQLDDPMRLPPKSAFVELSEGRAWGISTLSRSSPAVVTCLDNDTVIIEGKFSVDQLRGRYTWEKTLAGIKREGLIVIISDDFECTVKIQVPLQKGNQTELHPTLEDFRINRLKDVKLEMTGMGFFTWSLGRITTAISGVFRHAIAWAIQPPLKEALEREMREITLSF